MAFLEQILTKEQYRKYLDGSLQQGDISKEQMAELVINGFDISVILPDTGAGAQVIDGNEGHEPIFVDYLKPEVIPDSGFETTGILREYDVLEVEGNYVFPPIEESMYQHRGEENSPSEENNPLYVESPDHDEEEIQSYPDNETTQPENIQEEGDSDKTEDSTEGTDSDGGTQEETVPTEDVSEDNKMNNGYGNGDQDAPGNSEEHNNAENAGGNHDGTINSPGNSNHSILDIPQQTPDSF